MTVSGAPEQQRRQRPGGRTARVSERLLDATVQLIAEQGVEAVTYESVARIAGASRATLHRKWPRRDDLLVDALHRFAATSADPPDTGDIRADIVDLLCQIGDMLTTPIGRAIVNASVVADENDPIRAVGDTVLRRRLAVLQRRLDRAVDAGQLPPTDAAFVNTLLTAPVYVRIVRERQRVTRAWATRVVDTVLDGIRPR